MTSKALVPPGRGLMQLTWSQVQELDTRIRSLCAYTEETGEEVHLPIIVRNGKPVKIGQPLLLKRFSPTGL